MANKAAEAFLRGTGVFTQPSLDAAGLLLGALQTRSLPGIEGDRIVYRGGDVTPRTLGDVQILPKQISPRTQMHEDAHVQQSRDLGALYPLLSMGGGEFGPLEQGAYEAEPAAAPDAPQAERDDASSTQFMLDEIQRRRGDQPSLPRRATEALLRGLGLLK